MASFDGKDVDGLLEKMDLKSKIGQLSQIDVSLLVKEGEIQHDLIEHYIGELGIGSVLNMVASNDGADAPVWTGLDYYELNEILQETAKKYNHPPIIYGLDSVHGANYIHGSIITPQPLNIAATFNATMSFMAGHYASAETRQAGINWLFSPLLGIALEPKWSRVYETFGEDPFLVGQMANQMVQGIQQIHDNDNDNQNQNHIPNRAAACAKHFVGYPLTRTGHDRSPSWIPTRHLYQYFIPPWKKVVSQVMTIMESYTEIDGVPNVASRQVLDYLLRQRLGFNKTLVTDYSEIYNLNNWHHVASSNTQATIQTFQEGSVDMSMIPIQTNDYMETLQNYVPSKISQTRIDQSVKRILQLKHDLGLYHIQWNTTVAKKAYKPLLDQKPHLLNDVMEMTEQSIVLTKNDKNTLPLGTDLPTNILLTGPTIDSLRYQTGGWTWEWQGVSSKSDELRWFSYGDSVAQAFKQAAHSHANWKITVQCGVSILGTECTENDNNDDAPPADKSVVDKVKGWVGWGEAPPTNSMERAMAEATKSDLIIIAVGEENYAEKPGDIRDLALPSGQYELVRGIKDVAPENSKIVLVYFGGRPRLLQDMVDYADAVFVGFLPGPLAGQALVNLVTGDANPSAKLPITYPKYPDGGGAPYYFAVSDKCTPDAKNQPLPHWGDEPCEVQWPFGHGLSYTTFAHTDLKVTPSTLEYTPKIGDDKLDEIQDPVVTISVTVHNTGDFAGAETIMAFSFDEYRSTTPEYKRLRAFEKVWLEPSASETVTLTVPLEDLKFIGPHDDSHYIIQDGLSFRVGIGAETDCRMDSGNPLCSDPITIKTRDNYVGACEAACNLWYQSQCGYSFYSLSSEECWSQCTKIHTSSMDHGLEMNNDGWGWNYVNCLESVIYANDFSSKRARTESCWKLTSFCRDIFATDVMDEFGRGITPSAKEREIHHLPSNTSILLAVVSGIFAAIMMIYAVRGGRGSTTREEYEFAPVYRNSDDAENDLVV